MRKCQKCHGRMFGPTWNQFDNTLTYQCGCGFRKSVPAKDSEKRGYDYKFWE